MGGHKLLFIVNPVAGLGGPLALKGTDEEFGRNLLLRGVKPVSYERARRFLNALRALGLDVELITAKYLGYELAVEQGLKARMIYEPPVWPTRARDTVEAVRRGLEEEPELIVFAGGDGTAIVIADAMGGKRSTPLLGVPAGVKMYSGVFAANPVAAAYAVHEYFSGRASLCDAEIMDIDEEAFRRNLLRVKLHAIVKTICSRYTVSVTKQPSPSTSEEEENKIAIARYVVENYVKHCTLLVLGPGSTVAAIARVLGKPKSLLGVDVYHNDSVVALDVNEEKLYDIVRNHKGRKLLVVTPIGGQGFIFGRGNQQISPRILKLFDINNEVLIVATRSKIRQLGYRLRVDTGDTELDQKLRGYRKVLIDYNEFSVARVE